MTQIAKVLSDVALDREFDYLIPDHLMGKIEVGSHVLVPFGHRQVRGFVVALADASDLAEPKENPVAVEKNGELDLGLEIQPAKKTALKEIIQIIGDRPLIRPEIVKLARWMADYYCAPVENAIRTVLPGAVRKKEAKHKEQLNVRLNVESIIKALKNVESENVESGNVESEIVEEASSLFSCAENSSKAEDDSIAKEKSQDGSSTINALKNLESRNLESENVESRIVEEASSLLSCAENSSTADDDSIAKEKSQDGSSTINPHKNDSIDSSKNVPKSNPLFINYFDRSQPTAHLSGNLPHWRQQGNIYFVTFRLADSVPAKKMEEWCIAKNEWLKDHPKSWSKETFFEYYEKFPLQLERYLDRNEGACYLKDPSIKAIVESALLHFDGDRYRLDEFVIMPNHVHLLIAPLGDNLLSEILHSIKSFTANEISKALGINGHIWQKESFDHIIRSPEQLARVRQYIKDNPKNIFDSPKNAESGNVESRIVEEASSLLSCAENISTADDESIAKEKSQDGSSMIDAPKNVSNDASKNPSLSNLAKLKLTDQQRAVLSVLLVEKEKLLTDLQLAADVTASPIKSLEKKGLLSIEKATIYRDPHAGVELLKTAPMSLMPEQKTALDKICAATDSDGAQTVLLYGVTGSGKTEVYLQSIQHVLNKGQSSIVLVPEIALTPQTVDRFRSRFGEIVAVLHSSLSEGERHDEWARIRNGDAQIVIGARSALFAPVENLGLIVVDEEHEQTYKQDESPRYNARDVAVVRAHMEKCTTVLGSATPSLESYLNVLNGKYQMATMRLRVDDRQMPKINVIDMRLEAQREGKPSLFAKELLDAIGDRLHRTEQVMLFLNRRGFAASLICPSCGYVAECELCSVGMTYHKKDNRLGCHICGEERTVPEKCPTCGLEDFKKRGVGTERIEEVIQKCFKKARVFRMDSDTMRQKDAYRKVLSDFRSGKIDILIGTQMIAKGLDFPNVTLVGVINADITLHMPDFRAGERTYQLLTQVAGRAGRGDLAGEVIIQTYTPHHQAIQAVRNLGYEQFADQELAFREELLYPPYSHLVCLTLKGLVEHEVENAPMNWQKRC